MTLTSFTFRVFALLQHQLSRIARARRAVVAALVITPAFVLADAQAQGSASPTSSATMAPVNDLPNSFRTVEGWARLPDGRAWGSTSAVDIDKDGKHVWVAERCSANNCLNSTLDPILKFAPDGRLVASFGGGMIQSPHGIHVDPSGNIWVTDCSCTLGRADTSAAARAVAAAAPKRGHQIFKFAPDGKLLLTLGKAGGGRGSEVFYQPNDVLVAPNGS
ncbi:MAG: hypothetical protein ABIW79_02190, partial [Gemmatimonas sp.]